MSKQSEAEKVSKELYKEQYYNMVIANRFMSHAEISIDFFVEGVKWTIEQAEKLNAESQDYNWKLIEDIKQLLEAKDDN